MVPPLTTLSQASQVLSVGLAALALISGSIAKANKNDLVDMDFVLLVSKNEIQL
jgi:hypothetical protein